MATIICSDPLHPTREGEPGWSNDLGETDLPESPSGYFCGACAAHAAPMVAEPDPPDPLTAAAQQLEVDAGKATTIAGLKAAVIKFAKAAPG